MDKVNIVINNAKILDILIRNISSPEVTVTIGLFHDDKKVGEVRVSTNHYWSDGTFNLSHDAKTWINILIEELSNQLLTEKYLNKAGRK